MKTIEVLVRPDGSTTVTTKGFHGQGCREASAFLERALGRSTGEALTPEFYVEESNDERLSIRDGGPVVHQAP